MPEFSAGQIVGAKYRLLRLLAFGGMGSVWVARHVELDVDVAIKSIAAEDFLRREDLRKRFKREARVVAQLRSPNIVRVFDYGVEEGTPYIAMELLEGEDLKSRLDRLGALALQDAATIVRQVAAALDAAHRAKLVHRDVKPSNVFLAQEEAGEVVKLLDFGVAKDASDTRRTDDTTGDLLLGSPRYMSPEQAQAGKVDGRSDVWSLGAVVFEMLTGSPLFGAAPISKVLVQIVTADLPTVTERAPSLPRELDEVVGRALSRETADRYATAGEFAEALTEVSGRHPGLPAATSKPRTTHAARAALVRSSATAVAGSDADASQELSPTSTTADELERKQSSPGVFSLWGRRLAWVTVGCGSAVLGAWLLGAFRPAIAPSQANPASGSVTAPEPEPQPTSRQDPVTAAPRPSPSGATSSSLPAATQTGVPARTPPASRRPAPRVVAPAAVATPSPSAQPTRRDSDFGIPTSRKQ